MCWCGPLPAPFTVTSSSRITVRLREPATISLGALAWPQKTDPKHPQPGHNCLRNLIPHNQFEPRRICNNYWNKCSDRVES
jgi:hypothetical protein